MKRHNTAPMARVNGFAFLRRTGPRGRAMVACVTCVSCRAGCDGEQKQRAEESTLGTWCASWLVARSIHQRCMFAEAMWERDFETRRRWWKERLVEASFRERLARRKSAAVSIRGTLLVGLKSSR